VIFNEDGNVSSVLGTIENELEEMISNFFEDVPKLI
jgi:hypothetical protein